MRNREENINMLTAELALRLVAISLTDDDVNDEFNAKYNYGSIILLLESLDVKIDINNLYHHYELLLSKTDYIGDTKELFKDTIMSCGFLDNKLTELN